MKIKSSLILLTLLALIGCSDNTPSKKTISKTAEIKADKCGSNFVELSGDFKVFIDKYVGLENLSSLEKIVNSHNLSKKTKSGNSFRYSINGINHRSTDYHDSVVHTIKPGQSLIYSLYHNPRSHLGNYYSFKLGFMLDGIYDYKDIKRAMTERTGNIEFDYNFSYRGNYFLVEMDIVNYNGDTTSILPYRGSPYSFVEFEIINRDSIISKCEAKHARDKNISSKGKSLKIQ